MSAYHLKDKVAIVTGAGSGIGHAVAKLLLEAGCSVMLVDLNLRLEAESTFSQYDRPPNDSGSPTALFYPTDLRDWAQIQTMWDRTLKLFGRVDIVASIAGVYEPPWSNFWNPPGISSESKDLVDAEVGQYGTIAVNMVAPIRLAQIAVDYWTQHREIQGNFLAVASLAAYSHSLETPLYMCSKAGLVSFIKSMGGLKELCGIRFAALCPGAVLTPIFEPEWNKKLTSDDVSLSPIECAEVVLHILSEPQWGNGSVVETQKTGSKNEFKISVRDVPLESLYPQMVARPSERMLAFRKKLVTRIQEKGMRA